MEFTGFLLYASKHVKPFIIITPFFQHPKQNILLSSLTAPSDSPLLTPPSNPFRHVVSQGSESERRYFSVWTFFWLSHSGSLSSKSHLHYDSQSYGSDQNLISPSLLTPADFLASVVGCLMRIQAFTWTKQTLDCLPPTGMFPILVAHGKKKKESFWTTSYSPSAQQLLQIPCGSVLFFYCQRLVQVPNPSPFHQLSRL